MNTDPSFYTWIPFYEELCSKLLDHKPADLIAILKQLPIEAMMDKDAPDGPLYELAEIDPYTFLAYLNKYGDPKRISLLGQLKGIMNLEAPAPTDVYGVPTAQAQRVWLFGYKFKRQPGDIPSLWSMYSEVQRDELTNARFEEVLQSFGVGKAKITEVLFYQNPHKYLPINSQTKPWLSCKGLSSDYETYADYLQLLNVVKQHDSRPFYEISREAYLQNMGSSTLGKFYCVGVNFNEGGGNQLERFINEGVWENGNGTNKPVYTKLTQSVPVGAKIAAKANNIPNQRLDIKAIGEVVDNLNDGITLKVNWQKVEFSLPGKGAAYPDTIREVKKLEDIEAIFQNQELPKLPESLDGVFSEQNNEPKFTRNIILYGPPGTGKTYGTIDLAVEIIDGSKHKDHKINKSRFDQLREQEQIDFVTFHQNYTYEDFVIGLKPDIENRTKGLVFKRTEGIFYQMVKLAKSNYEESLAPKSKSLIIPFDLVFAKFTALLGTGNEISLALKDGSICYLIELQEKYNALYYRIGPRAENRSPKKDSRYLSVQTLKELYQKGKPFNEEGIIYEAIVDRLLSIGSKKTELPARKPKNFVLIIDEINRANISRVFGELITLLEEDKRLGSANELSIKLSNGEPFSVPPNLYIIATMNTADKSLALLDIALRRRFEFRGIYPDRMKLEKYPIAQKLMVSLNEAIYKHKNSADFLIGHGYFMNTAPIKEIMNKRIIPLLMEYFNGRSDLVQKILGEANIEATRNPYTYQLEYDGTTDQPD